MSKKLLLRAVPALLVIAAAVTLAACNLARNLPAGQAYLTISNASTSSYTSVYVDSKSLPDIAAGNSYPTAVTIGQHDIRLDFLGKPVGPTVINVPSQGCTLQGPTDANPSQLSGC